MKENKYDSDKFFKKYSEMDRSKKGLKGAGEWSELQKVLPDFSGKRVLDLGCGYGWHCMYAAEHGAESVVGIDISKKMLETAKEKNSHAKIEYRRCAMEDLEFPKDSFDAVISSLAFHYVKDFEALAEKISQWTVPGGQFVFSAEHPVFTAYGTQDWYYDKNGEILHFPVDRYFYEGKRDAVFLGEQVVKYHRTLTGYLNTLLCCGFVLRHIIEPKPTEEMMDLPGMQDEMRRPMMLIVAAEKDSRQ
ncbi:class I SAM-dependent methyltransferase [Anaerostipes sp.]|uniref:class I SAM-dependent methyltransferase n=1 Tax=Anaerostipes sp. TaxID=1872530 RepID=UPI0025BBCBA4|nr:class I SAM-dependent methyltransferase [Anaerostipes sp.]MBS7009704.1 class I SAM-dependent methyltransferase [Anaerostipes sp.]